TRWEHQFACLLRVSVRRPRLTTRSDRGAPTASHPAPLPSTVAVPMPSNQLARRPKQLTWLIVSSFVPPNGRLAPYRPQARRCRRGKSNGGDDGNGRRRAGAPRQLPTSLSVGLRYGTPGLLCPARPPVFAVRRP